MPDPVERITSMARRLADRQEIAGLCARYATALDTRDWALLESCFAPSPVFVHPGGRLEGFPAILERTKATRVQAYIWRDGNRAVVAR